MEFITIAAIGTLVVAVVVGAFYLMALRKRGSYARALSLVLFRITMPRDPGNTQRPEKELIGMMEQLYGTFSGLHASGWNKFLYGEPYISLELAVHHIGEETHIYMAVPRSYEAIFEKQVNGVFPSAEVEKTKDYNIFNPQGASAGVYLKLKGYPILPFKTYLKLESDPFGGIATALSKLEREGEGVSIQLLIRPSHRGDLKKLAQKVIREMQSGYDFKKALLRAEHPPKQPNEQDARQKQLEPSRVVTPMDDEIIKGIQSKMSKPLFDTNIRIVASAADEMRAERIIDDVTAAFSQFSTSDMASFDFKKLKKGGGLKKLIFNYAFRIFDNSRASLLSSEEITSIFHFPVTSNALPRLRFAKFKTAEPPANVPKEGIEIGTSVYRGQKVPIRMTAEDRRRHFYIVGQTGTGKSVTMEAMFRQDFEAGNGVTIIDPHGSLAEFALSVIPEHRAKDVIYFNPADVDYPMGLNLFEMDPKRPEQKSLLVDELFSIMDKLYNLRETGGPLFERYFKNAIFLLLDDYEHEVPTLSDLSRVFMDEAYRKDKLSRETNPMVRQFWTEAEKMTGDWSLPNMAGYVTSKLDAFNSNEFLRPIVNQKKSVIDFPDVIENKKILIVNLSKGRIGSLNADLMGMVIIGKLQRTALARDTNRTDMPDHYLYIDEFQNFSTDGISIILAEARKYKLCLVMAHQFIKQLQDKIRDAVFGNVGSMAVFRISPEDAESPVIKTRFEPVFTPGDVSNIENFNSYASILVNGAVTRPFNMRVQTERVFGQGSREVAHALAEVSRFTYGRPREEVEKELYARFRASGVLKQ